MMLYKFRPINEFTTHLVKNGDLWFCRMADLNDPFEGDFTFSQQYISNHFDKHSQLPEECNYEYHKTLIEGFRELKRSHLFVLSLTEKYMDTVMWSHYACNHSGVVIGIDFDDNHEMQFEDKNFSPIKRLDSYIHDVEYSSKPVVIDDDGLEEYRKIFMRKSEQWEYEQEKRIAFRDDELNAPGKSIKIDPSRIKEVHFGARTSREQIDKFIKDVDRTNGIEYQKMGFIHGFFRLTSFPI